MLTRAGAARALTLLAIAALLALIALRLGGVVSAGGGGPWDRLVLLAMRDRVPLAPLVAFTALGSGRVLALVVVVASGVLTALGALRHALLLVFVTATGGWLVDALKDHFARARPSLVEHLVPVASPSFPSAHAANSAIVYLTAAALLARVVGGGSRGRRMMAAAVALTILLGLSRIALGVHWPSDVLGGWGIGAAWALGWWTLAERLSLRRAVGESPDLP